MTGINKSQMDRSHHVGANLAVGTYQVGLTIVIYYDIVPLQNVNHT
jgi:hypothetical protein